ncbi:MAG: DUF1013 domain-containing protein [Alphaproteobacteria bacterium]|jgi:uncharacterized protein|nr:DUF1013 domain-containing protein [Alphaproteobacteria bacterium]MBT5827436.1 DUF1013 domain-containing protein [Alphaproteobacteria bacterium]
MAEPLMPLATAVWLVENTSLTFTQIAEFCNMHEMEVQTIADDESEQQIEGQNPVILGQITSENLTEAQNNPDIKLNLIELVTPKSNRKIKKVKYIPIAKRRDKPDAIAWLVKNHPEIPDSKIVKLIGTTKKTIESIKDRSYANMTHINPKDPVLLGLCSQTELGALVEKFAKSSAQIDSN